MEEERKDNVFLGSMQKTWNLEDAWFWVRVHASLRVVCILVVYYQIYSFKVCLMLPTYRATNTTNLYFICLMKVYHLIKYSKTLFLENVLSSSEENLMKKVKCKCLEMHCLKPSELLIPQKVNKKWINKSALMHFINIFINSID